jgi:hypothetical protein
MELTQAPDPTIDDALWDELAAADEAGTPADVFDGADDHAGSDTAVAPDPAPAAQKPSEQAPADPYAELPEAVRNALAADRQLVEQRVRSAEGRVAALQRELAQRPQAPAPQAEPPRRTKLDALREELPEVVEAIEEARGQVVDADAMRQQMRAEAMATVQEELLEDKHPDWAQKLTGQSFQSWLQTQPADYQAKVRGTERAAVMSAALTTFDQAQASAAAKQGVQAQRNKRIAAAVTPNGTRRVPDKSLDDLNEDEYWDELTKNS